MVLMYNEKTDKFVKENGSISLLNLISSLSGKDINILMAYYKYYNQYPSLLNANNIKEDKKFKIFERKYKINKLLKNK